MFEGRTLRRKRDKDVASYEAQIRDARLKHDSALADRLRKEQFETRMSRELDIDYYESQRVTDAADRLDVELPPSDTTGEVWILEPPNGHLLSSKGRALVRERIHEEKKRRFESNARWFKILAPLLAALAGVIGTITGLVAILKKH